MGSDRDRALDALCAAFARELDEADPAEALGRAYARAFGDRPARRDPAAGEDPGIRLQRELEEFYAEREAEQAARDARWAGHRAMGEAAYAAAMAQRGRGYRVRQPAIAAAFGWDLPARERFRMF